MKIILVDDEKFALDELSYLLEQYSDIEIIGKFANGKSAINFLTNNECDAIFLDIKMPSMDGLIVADKISNLPNPPFIVFVTAFTEHSISAFDKAAVDYLLKPVNPERLKKTVLRLRESLASKRKKTSSANSSIEDSLKTNKVVLKYQNRFILADSSDISAIFIKDSLIYAVINDKWYLANNKTLDDFYLDTDKQKFLRVHRAFIVNIDKIKEIIPLSKSRIELKVDGFSEPVKVSRINTKLVRDIFRF